jgi:hypothetical protein
MSCTSPIRESTGQEPQSLAPNSVCDSEQSRSVCWDIKPRRRKSDTLFDYGQPGEAEWELPPLPVDPSIYGDAFQDYARRRRTTLHMPPRVQIVDEQSYTKWPRVFTEEMEQGYAEYKMYFERKASMPRDYKRECRSLGTDQNYWPAEAHRRMLRLFKGTIEGPDQKKRVSPLVRECNL